MLMLMNHGNDLFIDCETKEDILIYFGEDKEKLDEMWNSIKESELKRIYNSYTIYFTNRLCLI